MYIIHVLQYIYILINSGRLACLIVDLLLD